MSNLHFFTVRCAVLVVGYEQREVLEGQLCDQLPTAGDSHSSGGLVLAMEELCSSRCMQSCMLAA